MKAYLVFDKAISSPRSQSSYQRNYPLRSDPRCRSNSLIKIGYNSWRWSDLDILFDPLVGIFVDASSDT